MLVSNSSARFHVNTVYSFVDFSVKQGTKSWGFNYTGKNRVATVKFCMKAFQKAKESFDYMACLAFKEDGYGEARTKMYEKMGFKCCGLYTEEGDPILQWGRGTSYWKRWDKDNKEACSFLAQVVSYLVKAGYQYKSSTMEELVLIKDGEEIKLRIYYQGGDYSLSLENHVFSSKEGHTLWAGEYNSITPLSNGVVTFPSDCDWELLTGLGWAEAEVLPTVSSGRKKKRRSFIKEEEIDEALLEYSLCP